MDKVPQPSEINTQMSVNGDTSVHLIQVNIPWRGTPALLLQMNICVSVDEDTGEYLVFADESTPGHLLQMPACETVGLAHLSVFMLHVGHTLRTKDIMSNY